MPATKKPKLIDLTGSDDEEAPWVLRRPDLCWTGTAKFDDAATRALREQLYAHNDGSPGLEALDMPYDVARAKALFERDGCVVLLGALDAARLADVRRGVAAVAPVVCGALPGGNRGSHRWSLGAASLSRHLCHEPAWAALAHLPATVAPVLAACLGDGYVCTGMGGELTAAGAVSYQDLHSDIVGEANNWDAAVAPAVAVNFVVQDFHRLNGPTRQITRAVAGFSTHRTAAADAPAPADESAAFRSSTLLVGGRLPAGAAVVRDLRAWHGGTPNVTEDELRALPNVEYASEEHAARFPFAATMPRAVYDGLDAEGRRLCARIVADGDAARGWHAARPDARGWATANADATREYRVRAADAAALVVHEQDADGGYYGVVDVGVRARAGGAPLLATKNGRSTRIVVLPVTGRIRALEVYERGGHGVVDVRLLFAGGADGARAFGDRAHDRVHVVDAPPAGVAGLAVREQDHYGVVDLTLV